MRTRLVIGLGLLAVLAIVTWSQTERLRAPTASAAATATSAASSPQSSPNPWDPAAAGDPCHLLTNTQVGTALGHPARPGVTLKSWPPLCKFTIDAPRTTIVYLSDNALKSGRADFDTLRTTTTGAITQPGLGDDAYWDPSKATLHVMVGNRHLAVIVVGSLPDSTPLTTATQVLHTALASLP